MYGEACIHTIREKVHICVEERVTNLGSSDPKSVALNRWLAWHEIRLCEKNTLQTCHAPCEWIKDSRFDETDGPIGGTDSTGLLGQYDDERYSLT